MFDFRIILSNFPERFTKSGAESSPLRLAKNELAPECKKLTVICLRLDGALHILDRCERGADLNYRQVI